ncbi:MAG: hypothetical protein IJF07_01990 [Lachnospiraceae bacterium]|nr:hypothetical protein [Lachnospiraceae bacterium]
MIKKIAVIIVAIMCLFLASCSTADVPPAMNAEYLTGTWEWQEEKSPNSITKMRCFKLKADGTGKILVFEGEELKSSELTWEIESHDSWSSVHLFSDENGWNCNYEMEGEYLVDLTGSDYFAKK